MKICRAIAICALATAGAAMASEPPAQTADSEKDPNKVICKTEKMTGSRTKTRRICMTRAEWDGLARTTKKGLDDFNRSAAGGANSSFDPSKMGGP